MSKIFKNVTWLTIGVVLSKLLGGIYKIGLTRILGGENIGTYQQIFPVYAFATILITAGVPLALSKIISQKSTQEERTAVFQKVSKIFFYISLALAIIIIIFSRRIAIIHGKEEFSLCYLILAPTIILSALTAVLKGYFNGLQNFKFSSISVIVEQISKIIFGLFLTLFLAQFGLKFQIFGAILGFVIGDLFSFLVLYIIYRKRRVKSESKLNSGEVGLLIKSILPFMLSSLALPFGNLIDSFLIVRLLNRNFETGVSSYLYGLQSGVVNTLINFPTTIIFSLSAVLLPSFSNDFAAGTSEKINSKATFSLKIILSIAVFCCFFILIFPDNIVSLIYGGSLDAFKISGTRLASRLLFWSGANIIIVSISQFFTICLQSKNHKILPIFNNWAGLFLKIILELIFVPNASVNILALSISTTFGNLLTLVLNIYEINKFFKIKFEKMYFLKLFLANLLSLSFCIILLAISNTNISFILAAIVSIIIYFMLIIKLNFFKKSDINYLVRKN